MIFGGLFAGNAAHHLVTHQQISAVKKFVSLGFFAEVLSIFFFPPFTHGNISLRVLSRTQAC
jgi:hypothetical protein